VCCDLIGLQFNAPRRSGSGNLKDLVLIADKMLPYWYVDGDGKWIDRISSSVPVVMLWVEHKRSRLSWPQGF